MNGEQWIIREPAPALAAELAAEHQISPVTAQVLINRGLGDTNKLQTFFSGSLADLPDPFDMAGVAEACEVFVSAIACGKRIVLFGDYDVDGMTGCAILYLFLKRCAVSVDVHIPDRMTEGYGLNIPALERLKQEGADIVVAIDNGTTAFKELEWAQNHGLQVIIIDHHESPQEIPPCAALVNPKHPQSAHPDKTLCSAGLAFNLTIALRARLRQDNFFKAGNEPDLRGLLDLVCLGTVADMVPLQGQNRLLVRYGLKLLQEGTRPGLAALKEVSAISARPIGTYEIGFQLAPRLNAAGRLANARLGFRLLTTEDGMEARQIADQLNRLNQQRRDIEQKILEEAVAQVESETSLERSAAIVVASPDWHPGVIGIVATRLTEAFHRPALVIALKGEKGKGSGRSFGGINLYGALRECADHLDGFGGHKQAAGLTIAKKQLASFTERFQAAVAAMVPAGGLCKTLHIDQVLPIDRLSPEFVDELERLAPFGIGNPKPLFVTEAVELRDPRVVGQKHLRVRVSGRDGDWPAIGFGLAERYDSETDLYQIAYRPVWNEFRGKRSLELQIESLRPYSN